VRRRFRRHLRADVHSETEKSRYASDDTGSAAVEYFNPVLLMILVSEVCLGICAWHSPRFLRRIAAHLLTRADVMDICRQENERRMKAWLSEFGLDSGPSDAKQPAALSRFSRDEVKVS